MKSIDKIDAILAELHKDYDWLVYLLEKYMEQRSKRASRNKEYYLKNKSKLDEYHRKYRQLHPEYRDKAKERVRKSRRK